MALFTVYFHHRQWKLPLAPLIRNQYYLDTCVGSKYLPCMCYTQAHYYILSVYGYTVPFATLSPSMMIPLSGIMWAPCKTLLF